MSETFGVQDGLSASGLTGEQRRSIEEEGYVILPGVLSEEECDLLSRTVDEIWVDERLGETHSYEPGVRFVPNLLRYSTVFERCVAEPRVLEAVRAVLGPGIRLNRILGRRSDPGHGNQPLHDLKRRRGRPFTKANTIWCLDAFTEVNGATRLIPGSHLSGEPFLSRCEDPLRAHPDERLALAPRGSVVVHNSHLLHGGTLNRSDAPRRSIHTAYTTPEVPPHWGWDDLPPAVRRVLKPRTAELMGVPAH
ncbi:phytanoyl-CoA dioxygenase family protein [Streptomyces hoynatensis]|uniref:phytanoyl-CoA dioxygenase family protein n=1 Tax=Streptomyces hoynatensis TaxID=1141874 RepID=UPI00131A314C|nr:phytanoyl-CoA dioxygenase family protein [Streptomyces hoynatensis]